MKKTLQLFFSFLFLINPLLAQQKGSLDLGYLRNLHSGLHGNNISYYHHVSKKWSAGIECIRFFPSNKLINEELEETISAWDIEFNVHYMIPFAHHWKFYPITGVGHTSEKENSHGEIVMHRFWSLNTGAGLGVEMGHWSPHIEYNLGWGKINQQFFLVGLSYELDWH